MPQVKPCNQQVNLVILLYAIILWQKPDLSCLKGVLAKIMNFELDCIRDSVLGSVLCERVILLYQDIGVKQILSWRKVYINRNGRYGIGLFFLLLLMVLIFPIGSAASEYSYPKTLEHPWDHSPITVYIDNKNLPPNYNPSYYTQIEKALNYWEEGGNGKLNYTPVFKIVDSENADIRITWVENLEKNKGAPSRVGGYTTPQIENGRFVHVDVVLGVGDYKGTDWIQYDDKTVLVLAEHELGHALGLEHSNDKQDIMYPDYKQQNDLSSLMDNSPLLIAGYGILAVIVFLAVSRLLDRRKG